MAALRALVEQLLFVDHADEIVVRRGRAVLLTAGGLVLICLVAVPVIAVSESTPLGYINIAVALLVYLGVIAATRRGRVLAAAVVFNLMNAAGPAIAMLTLPGPGTPFYLVFIPLLAAATLPPGAVAAAVVATWPLLVARYLIFSADIAVQREVLAAVLILLLTGVVAFVLSLTSEASIRRVKRALAELSELNATLEERVRARTAELAVAEQRRRDTMKGVGHDMGNLLMAMSGSASIATEALERHDLAEARQFLERFESVTLRLGRVAADLVDSALAETGQLTLQPRALDLAAATEAVLAELAGALARGQLAVSVSDAQASPAFADPDRIKRVMHNVIGNAIKYTPRGGRIEITVGAEGGRVVWTCRDTGRGVSPEQLALLGQELRRFDPAASQGVGLGLYTSQQIVLASGGEIAYSSAGAQAGTTVAVWLPAAPEGAPAAGVAAGGPPGTGQGRSLHPGGAEGRARGS